MKKIFCFSNRSSVYKGEKIKSIRNASIFTQLESINYLIKKYVAFRMGRNEDIELQII